MADAPTLDGFYRDRDGDTWLRLTDTTRDGAVEGAAWYMLTEDGRGKTYRASIEQRSEPVALPLIPIVPPFPVPVDHQRIEVPLQRDGDLEAELQQQAGAIVAAMGDLPEGYAGAAQVSLTRPDGSTLSLAGQLEARRGGRR